MTELLLARIVQWMLRSAAVALWLGTLIVPLHTQPAPPPPAPTQIKPAQIKDLHIPKLTTPPRLEQFLGGASRADLRRIDDFRQRQPGDGVPVSRKTSAWIGYDDRNFYAVFVCDAPPGQTRARLAKREDIFRDDHSTSAIRTGWRIWRSPTGPSCPSAFLPARPLGSSLPK